MNKYGHNSGTWKKRKRGTHELVSADLKKRRKSNATNIALSNIFLALSHENQDMRVVRTHALHPFYRVWN